MAKHPAPVLADLAAAYLVRADRDGTPRDLLGAIDAADEALEHDPGNAAARFNVALALQRLGLIEEATDAWLRYLQSDASSSWAGEARRQLAKLRAIQAPPPPPASTAPASSYAAYASTDPQGAREVGWCRVLGMWAEEWQNGNAVAAEEHLTRAEALAFALERRRGGDATLADGVRAIRAQSDRRATQSLAQAHREFASGCLLAQRADFPNGVRPFKAASNGAAASPALRLWARVMYGDMLFHSGNMRQGEAILRRVPHEVNARRYSALVGRAHQALAALMLRSDRYESALEEARQAAVLFASAGERENEGVARDAMAMARYSVRDADSAYALTYAALERLRPFRASYRLHNLLNVAAQAARDDGFPRAALRMQDEGVRVADRTGNPVFVAEARLTRARLRAAVGNYAGAQQDLEVGEAATGRLTESKARGWMTAERQMAAAMTTLRNRPGLAANALDSAAAFLLAMNARRVAFPAVVAGAQARLENGDAVQGAARLRVALELLEERRDSIRMESRRAAVFEAAHVLVNRVAMLRLAEGNAREALSYLDRGRASLAPAGHGGSADDYGIVSGPPGQTALEYALVGDTLLTWVVTGKTLQVWRAVVDTLELRRTTERARRGLEAGAGEVELNTPLSRLYERLVRPVAGRLGGEGVPLVIVADGAIAAVPFGALYDGRRRRYLIEDHPLRFAVSLREARRPARRPGRGTAVFVADPAFDPVRHPGFARLPQAAREASAIASGYPGAQVVAPAMADAAAVRAALGRASIFHYAGHAVFDDERPEQSYLLLASTPGSASASVLHAGEIAQMDLRNVTLVVLSACQSVRTGEGRAAGFSGLAGAFLAAGASGAVGSLWQVDDGRTRPLMVEFHRAYRASGNGAVALRAAQLALLRSRDPSLRSPAAWAAFRYMGS